MTISDWIDEISVKFDELGFVPTTLTDEKSEHFIEWFATEISEIKKEEERLKAENEQLKQTLSRMGTVEKELRERLEKAVELPRIVHPNPCEWFVQYEKESGLLDYLIFYSKEAAEERLAELRGANAD